MITKINLSDIKKCSQDWNQMEACEGGRFCGKCSKRIYDFRGKSEEEIARIHALSEESTFKSILAKIRNGISIKGVILSLWTFFGSTTSNSQTVLIDQNSEMVFFIPSIESTNTEIKKTEAASIEPIILKGSLRDGKGQPIVYGTVVLKNSTIGTNTDEFGNYELDVTRYFENNDSGILLFKYIGKVKKEMKIFKRDMKRVVVIAPEMMETQTYTTEFRVIVRSEKKVKFRWLKNLFKRKK